MCCSCLWCQTIVAFARHPHGPASLQTLTSLQPILLPKPQTMRATSQEPTLPVGSGDFFDLRLLEIVANDRFHHANLFRSLVCTEAPRFDPMRIAALAQSELTLGAMIFVEGRNGVVGSHGVIPPSSGSSG